MRILSVIVLVVSILTWAQAKQNKPKGTDRKPADSHGGVETSNNQFATAVKFALNEGGTLARVISVKKRIDCNADTSAAYFEVVYGSRSSQTGQESAEHASMLRVPNKKIYTELYQKDPDYDGEYKAESYSGKDCKVATAN